MYLSWVLGPDLSFLHRQSVLRLNLLPRKASVSSLPLPPPSLLPAHLPSAAHGHSDLSLLRIRWEISSLPVLFLVRPGLPTPAGPSPLWPPGQCAESWNGSEAAAAQPASRPPQSHTSLGKRNVLCSQAARTGSPEPAPEELRAR